MEKKKPSLKEYMIQQLQAINIVSEFISEEKNLYFQITDAEGTVLFSNTEKPLSEWSLTQTYGVLKDEAGNITDVYPSKDAGLDDNAAYYTVSFALKEGRLVTDDLSFALRAADLLYL